VVLLPILLDDMDLEWGRYEGAERLVEGRLGMAEPAVALGRDAIAGVDLVLAPALAVDVSGHRVGQGGGSYDRAIARTRAPVVAVVWDDEVLGDVPVEAHDRPVAGVLTPSGGLQWLREVRLGAERSLP
jgi:5-formyltetrahydrofolate cyclo-ligase